MVSFDVSSLFTNVPLEYTINIILDKIYREKLISTKLKKEELRKLLYLCTKEMHFSFNGQLFQQIDGEVIGSPLRPVLAYIFMVHLETSLVPVLSEKMPLWLRYVDDTFTFIKEDNINDVINVLNAFHPNIKFTCEKEENKCISFLDVNIIRKDSGRLSRDVFRKQSDNNMYLHWKSFAPDIWKIVTLKGLIRRAFKICSEDEALDKEIKHLKFVFTKN